MTAFLIGITLVPAAVHLPAAQAAPAGQGFHLNVSDLRFILKQIKIAERHAATATAANPCGTLLGPELDQIPNATGAGSTLPWGLRTVDGTCNNLVAGQHELGSANKTFPRLTSADFRSAEAVPAGFFGPGSPGGAPTSYTQSKGSVFDSQPRLISNLIADQSDANPAAVESAGPSEFPCTTPGVPAGCTPTGESLFIPNVAPDVGLSAPYNSWFTLFGQFFDHGLDLTGKGGSGTVFMPLKSDDPLYKTAPGSPNFMVLTRSTNRPGPDGILGDPDPAAPDTSLDDVKNATNRTSPFVDQSQTYTSHPSHQVFLREYATDATGNPVSTGKLLTNPGGGMADWRAVKAQARTMLGIRLVDADVASVPLLATDPYGRFIRGTNGYPQIVTSTGLVSGDPAANGGLGVPVPATAVKTGQAFLDDIAHHAVPKANLTADSDATITATDSTQPTGTYDDEMLDAHFMAGDGRVNENIGLTAVHHVFHSEHNRLTGDIKNVITTEDAASLPEWQLAPGVWNGERLFQAARFVTEMEYQHLAFEEFARKVQPQINVFSGYDASIDPAIVAEFAHAVYRFGHSMLNETVARTTAGGFSRDIPLLEAFLNPPEFTAGGRTPDQSAGDIIRGMTEQHANELDEFVTEALRNRLLGLPLDLASLNVARAREAGVPPLNAVRRQLFDRSQSNPDLAPYANWNDFGLALKHRSSLVNFVAAYGTHPSIVAEHPGPNCILADDPATLVDESADNLPAGLASTRRAAAALLVSNGACAPADSVAFMQGTGSWADVGGRTTTGLDVVDLWIGGLAEKQQPFGGLLGSTFNYVFETQMEKLQDGDRFYYLARTAGLNLLVQLEGNSFAELIARNTDAENLPADSFSRLDFHFHLGAQAASGPIVDDPKTSYAEPSLLIRMADNTIRFNGPEHVAFNGTSGADMVWSSEGDDTLRGNEGNDRLEGGAGNDSIISGPGDDVLTDLFGDDVTKGGDGNDAISSGQGFDLNQPGRGNDFVIGGSDPTETFGGPGNDFIFGGDSTDIVFGDDGDDWIEGGSQADLLQGDNGAPFQDDPNTPGHDVIDGDGGADDYDAEGGDDILVAGPGIERLEGMLGFDWVTHKGDPVPANADMRFTGLLPPSLDTLADRFDVVESLSGWTFDDVLRGDDTRPGPGNELNAAGIARISGLNALLPNGATGFAGGNIILGGAGSDLIEGRGGDDIIDGDKYLNVRLSVRSSIDPSTELQSADSMSQLRAAVFAGSINPGQIRVVREILTGASATDTAVFTDVRANYDCIVGTVVTSPCGVTSTGVETRVVHARGIVPGGPDDGTDTIRNIERLVFGDSVAPGTPAIGTAVAGVGTVFAPNNGTATVDFSAVAGAAPTEFLVRVVNAAGFQVGALRSAPAGATSLDVTGLTNGTPVRFQVQALNVFGPSAFSALSNAVTPTTVPDAPTIDSATAGNALATVHWTAPTVANSGGTAVTGFTVQVLNPAGAQVGALRTAPPGTGAQSLDVDGLTNGTTYRFQVRAVNAAGSSAPSALSNGVTPTSGVVVGTTTSLGISPASPQVEGTSVVLSAAVSPDAAGTFQFFDGGRSLGVPGAATRTVTPSVGTHSYTAAFVPANPAAFGPSTSAPRSVVITARPVDSAPGQAPPVVAPPAVAPPVVTPPVVAPPVVTPPVVQTPVVRPPAVRPAVRVTIVRVKADGAEFVKIRNTGRVAVNLRGWTLMDRSGQTLRLKRFILTPGQRVKVYTGVGTVTADKIFLGKSLDVWGTSDTAKLFNRSGTRVARLRY